MKKTWWLASFIVIGVLLGAGVLQLVTRPPRGKPIELLPIPTPAPIIVYVSGAVNSPGSVNLPPGSRVNDAVMAADGLREDADTSLLNPAKLLEDGELVNVPFLGSPSGVGGETNRAGAPSLLIDINSATLEQLDTLPEIGPITAQDIIDYRAAFGPFVQIEDILDVRGIGQATFNEIKDFITVGTVIP
jgi:competence protein ComEA